MLGFRFRSPEPAPAPRRPTPAINGVGVGQPWATFDPPAPPIYLRSQARPATRTPAVLEELREEFENKPWAGDSYIEMLPAPAAEPPRPAPQPLVIPPPPWQDQLEAGTLDLAAALNPPAPPTPLPNALAELKREAGEDFPDWPLEVVTLAPLQRFVPPEPDWQAEAAEQAARDRAEQDRARREARAELLAELLAEAEDTDERKEHSP